MTKNLLSLEEQAYKKGWIEASKWANRPDLIADIDSKAFIRAMELALSTIKPINPVMEMKPMEFDDGRIGWYIAGTDFYCDIEPEIGGQYSIFYRDGKGREGFFDPTI